MQPQNPAPQVLGEPNSDAGTPSEQVGTKLLFENEAIRVWDLSLAPGESLPTHIHRLPYCFIVSKGGHLRHDDPARPEEPHDVHFENDLVVYLDPTGQEEMVHQTLTNVGDTPYQNYIIELKKGA